MTELTTADTSAMRREGTGRTCTTRSGRHGIAGLHTARQVAYAALARESA
jgi:hypothetical protein